MAVETDVLAKWLDAIGTGSSRRSVSSYQGNGTTTSFNFSFSGGYIAAGDIKAYVYDDVAKTSTDIATPVLTGPGTILVTPALPATKWLVVYRSTYIDAPLVDFAAGAPMTEKNLDDQAKQATFSAAELTDRFDTVSDKATTALAQSTTAATQAAAAVVTANATIATANTANANASAAVTTANTANTKADAALSYTLTGVPSNGDNVFTGHNTFSFPVAIADGTTSVQAASKGQLDTAIATTVLDANAVSTNTANKVVKRDGSGNFAANAVTVSTLTATSGNAGVKISDAAGIQRNLWWQTAGSNRWAVYVSAAAESGSNAGSNWNVQRYDDSGTVIDQPLSIPRATGLVTATVGFSGTLTGNASSATKLATARAINGVNFDGTAPITVVDSAALPKTGGALTGNLAVGTTSAPWSLAGYSAVDVGAPGNATFGGPNQMVVTTNAYFSGGAWKYGAGTSPATIYNQNNGSHIWQTASPGAAGATITFSTAMLLDGSGQLGIGTTPVTMVHIKGAGATPRFRAESTSGVVTEFLADTATAGQIGTNSNHPFVFTTNSAERMRIAANGQVTIQPIATPTATALSVGNTTISQTWDSAGDTFIDTIPTSAGSGGGIVLIRGNNGGSGAAFGRVYVFSNQVSGGPTGTAMTLLGASGSAAETFSMTVAAGRVRITAASTSGGNWHVSYIGG